MAQYDLLLTQNVAAAGIEFSEKYVNIAKGSLLSANSSGVPTVLAVGTDTYMLVADSSTTTGLKWQAVTGGHTQGTDTGTTSAVFELDSDGYKIELTAESASKLGVKVDGGGSYADLQVKDATIAALTLTSGTVSTAPSGATDIVNKTYADGLIAAADAMVFKGTVGTGGTHEIAAFNSLATYNAGWTYRVITAGTVKGKVCEVGDLVVAMVDRAGSGNVDADFTVAQTNLDGAVIGPASVTDGYVALFDGTTGKLLKAGSGALGTAAYTASTAYATAVQGSTADGAIQKSVLDAAEQMIVSTGASTPAKLAVGASTFVGRKASGSISAMSVAEAQTLLTLGTAAYTASTAYATSAQGTTADNAIPKATLTAAQQILIGTGASTPSALTVGTSTIVGRTAAGNLAALTPAEAMNILWVTAPAAKGSTGTAGQIAKDANWFYICTATNTWKRSPIATNWT